MRQFHDIELANHPTTPLHVRPDAELVELESRDQPGFIAQVDMVTPFGQLLHGSCLRAYVFPSIGGLEWSRSGRIVPLRSLAFRVARVWDAGS